MDIFVTVLVTMLAGLGAGLGTGFAGMSAAAVISPMLIAFLGVDPYMAVAVALASDVLASAVSAYTYARHRNVDIKHGFVLLIFVLAFTVVGSVVAQYIPQQSMEIIPVVMTTLLGVRFIVRPVANESKGPAKSVSPGRRVIKVIFSGILIGYVCGFIGAGGGMMMLFALTSVLGYELKTAVGTSVFIMTFTALTGSVSHFVLEGFPDPMVLGLCMLFTLIFARLAALIANRVSHKVLNRVTGCVLVALGASIFVFSLIAG